MSITTARSSWPSGSSVASCESSSLVGMKCPERPSSLDPRTSRLPSRCRNTTPGAWARIASRYPRFNAEQATTRPLAEPASSRPTVPSQGARSSSFRGVPAAILAMFSTGCRESPSANGRPSSCATRAPIVVLPQPETPITTMCCTAAAVEASVTSRGPFRQRGGCTAGTPAGTGMPRRLPR